MVDGRIYTPSGAKGVSEEFDEAPLTAAETLERIRLHNEGKAQASSAPAQAEDESGSSSSDESDDESSGISSAEDAEKIAKKSRNQSTTPRKPTTGLQQLGGNSGGKQRKDETAAADETIALEIRVKMEGCADSMKAQLKQYAQGMFDAARGRQMQTLHREWGELTNTAKKLLKIDGKASEKQVLQLGLQQLEATMSLMKMVAKPSASYLETASCYDTLKLAGGTASEGCARALLDRNVDAKLSSGDVQSAIGLMTKDAAAAHKVFDVLPQEKIAPAQMAIATKVVQSVCKIKVVGSLEVAQSEAADAVTCLTHCFGYDSFPEELRGQLESMFTALHPTCAEAAKIRRAAEFTSNFPLPDARKPPESPFAAFLLSKVGKQAAKNLAGHAASAAKATAASTECAATAAGLDALSASESVSLRLLQLEAMPRLRKLKNCCKGADPAVVQQTLTKARALFIKFGSTSVQSLKDCAGFLFDSAPLFGGQPAPEEQFQACYEELREFGALWQELHTDIAPSCYSTVPAAVTETVAASAGAAVDTFSKYAKLGQEVASETPGETSAESWQSLGTRLLDSMQPETFASIEVFVTAPSYQVAPSCDI